MVAATAMFAGNFLVPLAGGPLWLIIGALIVGRGAVGLGAVFLIITRSTRLQQTVPPEQIGRVSAIVNLVEWGSLPIGSLLGGLLGQALGLRPALFVLAAGGMTAVPWAVAAALRDRQAPADPAAEPRRTDC